MATTIITKNGSGAPLAGDLTAGELAVDLTNKRLYSKDSGGTVIELGTTPSSFTSVGIDDNATSTAITIDSSENVGIGATPNALLDVSSGSTSTIRLSNSDTALSQDQITGQIEFYQVDDTANGTGITGKIGMRSVTQTGGGTYYGNVADMAFYVSGQANGY